VRENPLGLALAGRGGLEQRLYTSDRDAWRHNFVFLGTSPQVSPVLAAVGASVEVQPASFFRLRLAADFVQAFHAFGSLQSFDSPLAVHSDEALAHGETGSAKGGRLTIAPRAQARLGRLALRDELVLERWWMDLPSGRTVFYDFGHDTLVSGNGFVASNDLDAAWLAPPWIVGVRAAAVLPLYDVRDYADGDDTTRHPNGHVRAGPLASYVFPGRARPTAFLFVAWYVFHEDRVGPLPYVLTGLAVDVDI
jgi:hypothetical protein